MSGNFVFTINGNIQKTVATGTCTAPFQVPAGQATVVETPNTFSAVSSITTQPASRLVSASLASGTASVSVPAGDISTTTTVAYTNKAVTGYVEVCKKAATGSGLTGNFEFTITGAMSFSTKVSVPVGACSNPVQVPAGSVKVTESGDAATYVTAITTQPADRLVSSDLSTATATVTVPAGDVSTETIATFTNDSVRLKICKVAGDNSLIGQSFGFSVSGTKVSVPAGPGPDGVCELVPVNYRAGTQVTVIEDIAPGTRVSAITVAPSGRTLGTADLAGRSVTVTLGSGETVVTYTNIPAPPGTLKICKSAGTGVAVGSLWAFTVSGTPGTTSVPAGSCEIVGAFPFNSTQTVTETPTAGFGVSAISVAPASRGIGTPNLGAGTASVMIGDGVTEVQYTNSAVSPPPTTTTTSTSATPTTTSTTSTSTSTSTSKSTSTSTSTGSTSSKAARVIRASVASVKVTRRQGRHYLVIKVSSKSKHARIRVTELNKHGKALKRMTMTVTTNRMQSIRIPYGANVANVKVVLLP